MNGKLYNVGMYVRISHEGSSYIGEDSLSIENQQAMLSRFISMMPGWIEKKIYIDNGASGANFNRKGFQDMLSDVRKGIINLVLVKDLSRFGRNYLEAGKYLEDELPALGCRFVALADGIDTETGENDIMPFLNAINDFYIKNLSDRVKDVFMAKAKDGQKISGTAPYGYERKTDERTRLVVDEYAAGVVKRIFQARAEGMGYSRIAGILNKENILPPRLYYFKRHNRRTKAVCTDIWSVRTVKLILRNEIYIGNTISFKRKSCSYRDRREIKCGKDEWIRVENTHTPIIDRSLWQTVQRMNEDAKNRFTNIREPQQSLFSGIAVCADCHSSMAYVMNTSEYKSGRITKYGGYTCRTYCRSGYSVCSRHRISENHLKTVVLDQIEKISGLIVLDEEKISQELEQALLDVYKTARTDKAKEWREIEQQLYALESKIEQLYDERLAGEISTESFSDIANKIEAQYLETKDRLSLLEEAIQQIEANLKGIKMSIRLTKEKFTFDEVDRELLEGLIDKIEVGEKAILNDGKTQDLRIFYKYAALY